MAGIYLHIPFCKSRCSYCDFYSTTSGNSKERYLEMLCKEIKSRKNYIAGYPVRTIYFGGGTPSQLNINDFKCIFEAISTTFDISQCEEITLEANPDDLNPQYIKGLRDLSFNRISIGIQTFNDQLLHILNRRHTGEQAIQAVSDCRSAGFKNISIDLMYGLPGETDEIWESDLDTAIKLGVEHISAYHLIYEKGTVMDKMREQQKIKEIDEDLSVSFFKTMIKKLTEAGYIHYEISNFCKPNMYSIHNSSYWKGNHYLGCGPSAHSYNGNSRQWNISSIKDYVKGIESDMPYTERENLDLTTQYNDFIITSLRTMWGLSLSELNNRFGKELHDYCLRNSQAYLASGKMLIKNNTLYIHNDGIFISDAIMSDLLFIEE